MKAAGERKLDEALALATTDAPSAIGPQDTPLTFKAALARWNSERAPYMTRADITGTWEE